MSSFFSNFHTDDEPAASSEVLEVENSDGQDDADMVIYVHIADEPEGDEWEVVDTSYAHGNLPLDINGTEVSIPWTIRIVKLQ